MLELFTKGDENLITQINYSRPAREALACLFFVTAAGLVKPYDRGTNGIMPPEFMRGRIVDTFSGAATMSAVRILNSYFEQSGFQSTRHSFLLNTKLGNALQAYGAQSVNEFLQLTDWWGGTFDPGDLVAYGIGIGGWFLLDTSARKLYDSNATVPLYRWLHIQDRRLNPRMV